MQREWWEHKIYVIDCVIGLSEETYRQAVLIIRITPHYDIDRTVEAASRSVAAAGFPELTAPDLEL